MTFCVASKEKQLCYKPLQAYWQHSFVIENLWEQQLWVPGKCVYKVVSDEPRAKESSAMICHVWKVTPIPLQSIFERMKC